MTATPRTVATAGHQREDLWFDVQKIRADFPALQQKIHGQPLVYLDNAATSQKPQVVLEAIQRAYAWDNANIHRGVHELSVRATDAFEASRRTVQQTINAAHSQEIIFVRGTTEAINLVAYSYAGRHVRQGDEIIISAMEHHSNIVPWQIICEEKGAHLRVIPVADNGELLLDEYEKLLSSKTRLVAIAHVSSVLGSINPARRMIEMARVWDVPVLLDGAQAIPHFKVDVRELDCDFYAFSGHKVLGPTGIGVLYGKEALLESMPPYQTGGSMIESVSFEKTTYASLPEKFEAGTPHIAGGIALGPALDYLNALGLDRVKAYEDDLLAYTTERLLEVPGLRILGLAKEKACVLSFVLEEIHAHDIGTILDGEGVAIRTGHHCAQPLMDRFRVPATARASFSFYNTRNEVDRLAEGLLKAIEVFS